MLQWCGLWFVLRAADGIRSFCLSRGLGNVYRRQVYGPPVPAAVERARTRDDVVCLAGCIGKRGQVLQHVTGLPPPPRKAASVKEQEERLREARE